MRAKLAVTVVLGLALFAAPAWAGGSDTSSPECYTVSAGWNAPNGTTVFNRGQQGVTRAIVDAMGESRTHTMISHGPNTWVSHSTMYSPGTNGVCKACDEPVRANELQAGYPGASRVNQGAIYSEIYGEGGVDYVYYQGPPSLGVTAANTLLNNCPTQHVNSRDNSNYLYRYLWNDGTPIVYNPYGFRNGEACGTGDSTYKSSTGGLTCSLFAAHVQRNALGSAYPVQPYTYGSGQVCNALNTLKSKVESDCNSGQGFWSSVGAGIACTFCDLDLNVCDDAGRQVGRCFLNNNCDNGHDDTNCDGATATTVSPDRVGGWAVHPTNATVWAPYGNSTVSWNQPGSSYGCWF
jgi:hypothetical protein